MVHMMLQQRCLERKPITKLADIDWSLITQKNLSD